MTKTLKIGMVFDDGLDRADGVQQQIRLLGTWLSSRGHQVRYLVGETKLANIAGGRVYSLSKSIGVTANQNRLTLPRPVPPSAIKKILDTEQFDVLHVMLPFSPFLGARVIRQARARRIPLIGTFHTYPATRLQTVGSMLYGHVIRRTLYGFSQITSVSAATHDYARRYFDVDSRIVPNFIDRQRLERGRRRSDLHQAKYLIVNINRLVRRKGPQHLLKACAALKADGRLEDVHVYICGQGGLEPQLRQFIHERGLNRNVTLTGFITETDKADYLASADLAVFPSTSGEAFGIVLIEAMSAGALTLGGNNPGYQSVLGSYPELLVDVTDTATFANRLIELLTDDNKRRSALSWQARSVKQFDITAVGPVIERLYLGARPAA